VMGKPKFARHLPSRKRAPQASLFEAANDAVIDEMRNLDIESLTAEEAIDALRRLKARLL
jgi:hypothetical protein